jgi:hypothetical protein
MTGFNRNIHKLIIIKAVTVQAFVPVNYRSLSCLTAAKRLPFSEFNE